LKTSLQSKNDEVARLKAKVKQLSSSLQEAENDNSALSAKLSANRSAASQIHSSQTPGSAVKGGMRTMMMGSEAAAQAAVFAQLKEDLYSDLTGLIIRSVKKEEDADVYDCLQTGRNGSEYSLVQYTPNPMRSRMANLHP
jgi:Chromosome segregation protein Csm1/Pcs1